MHFVEHTYNVCCEPDSTLISGYQMDGSDKLVHRPFKSIINEDTTARGEDREKGFIHSLLSYAYAHCGVKPSSPGLDSKRRWFDRCVFCEVRVMMNSIADSTVQPC